MLDSSNHRQNEPALTSLRRSGILLHPTSLPGPFGVGDLGEGAYRFVDFLAAAGQTYWQILPLSPTGYGNSPYQGVSAFAGNPILVSPEKLAEVSLLSGLNLSDLPDFSPDSVDFESAVRFKTSVLDRAHSRFESAASSALRESYQRFCAEHAFWLDDFALFMALKSRHDQAPWYEWGTDLAQRQPAAMADARSALADLIEREKLRQWLFFEQWLDLKRYANGLGIRIIGDVPIFVSLDSADVWANPHLFHLDERLRPTCVSGVPPDYFSKTGQLWGHPLYRWDRMEAEGYYWWISRFALALTLVDAIRIDHFRGFHNYWRVPAGATSAIGGCWDYGPGERFFRAVVASLGRINIIAEDLGDFDAESRIAVDSLKSRFGFPGMKVLQFAFGSDAWNAFLPHNYDRDCVVYTGTHDNDTTVGWFRHGATRVERARVRRYLGRDGSDIAWDMIRLAWASVANTAIVPVQDLLSLGQEARMNTPGTTGAPNWCWRLRDGALTEKISTRLLSLTETYGRKDGHESTLGAELSSLPADQTSDHELAGPTSI